MLTLQTAKHSFVMNPPFVTFSSQHVHSGGAGGVNVQTCPLDSTTAREVPSLEHEVSTAYVSSNRALRARRVVCTFRRDRRIFTSFADRHSDDVFVQHKIFYSARAETPALSFICATSASDAVSGDS